jgi:RNA polymerase sigma-70 factor (ECF subfamily)
MLKPANSPSDPAPGPSPGRGQDEFSAHFASSFRLLWLIAAGVVGDRSLADDVLQEAALIALNKFDQFQPGTSFTAWMGQMVRNVALNMSRKERRRRPTAMPAPSDRQEPAARNSGSEQHSANSQLLARGQLPAEQQLFDDRVMAALSAMEEVPRACLFLRTLENLEYSEISMALGIPEGTAMSHVHRARKFLHARLRDMSPGGGPAAGLSSNVVRKATKPS